MNRTWLVVCVAVATGFGLGVVSTGRPSAATEPSVAAAVSAPEMPEYVVASGPIESVSEEVELQSKLVGRLKSVLVDEGDAVVAGQPLGHRTNTVRAAAGQGYGRAPRFCCAEASLSRSGSVCSSERHASVMLWP